MKTGQNDLRASSQSTRQSPALIPWASARLAVCEAGLLLLLGCAVPAPVGMTRVGPRAGQPLHLEPGPIALASPSAPATFSFQPPARGVGYQEPSPSEAAAAMLGQPILHDPAAAVVESAVRFAATPFVAAGAAVSGNHTLSPAQQAGAESDLTKAMAAAAGQQQFIETLLKAAGQQPSRRLFPVQGQNGAPGAAAVLEAGVEELRLERLGKNDDSFALLMRARARLVRTSDGAVLSNQTFEYRSGPDRFLDWTRNGALAGVAHTGCRELAQLMVAQLLGGAQDGPVLSGAGYRKTPASRPNSSLLVAAPGRAPSPVQWAKAGTQRPAPMLVDFVTPAAGSVGIYSTANVSHVSFQQPMTKDEAAVEAIADTERALDGIYNSPNAIVSACGIAAAVPMSLWKQTVGLVRGVTEKQYRQTEASLAAAAHQTQPHEQLAAQLAQQLAPQTPQRVMLVKKALPAGTSPEIAVMACMNRGTLAGLPEGRTAGDYLVSQGADTALEIHVLSAGLRGAEGINPGLALNVEAQARLFRPSDGQELYFCPVQYRSATHQFTQWGAKDARLFRQEMDRCYREMAGALAEQLVARGAVTPSAERRTTFAGK